MGGRFGDGCRGGGRRCAGCMDMFRIEEDWRMRGIIQVGFLGWRGADEVRAKGHFLKGSIFGLRKSFPFGCRFHGGVCVECG